MHDDCLVDVRNDTRREVRGAGKIRQNRPQALRLVIRQEAGIPLSAATEPPYLLIAGDIAVPSLKLDHEQAGAGQEEQVDLVEAPLVVRKRYVRPCAGYPVVGQELTNLVKRLGFLRLGGITHDTPQRRISPHLCSTPPRQNLLHSIRAMDVEGVCG
nr:hypothetical protein [Microbacterium sp.]